MLQIIKNRLIASLFLLMISIICLPSSRQETIQDQESFPVVVYYSPTNINKFDLMVLPLSSTPSTLRDLLAKQYATQLNNHAFWVNEKIWHEGSSLKNAINESNGIDGVTIKITEKKLNQRKLKEPQ